MRTRIRQGLRSSHAVFVPFFRTCDVAIPDSRAKTALHHSQSQSERTLTPTFPTRSTRSSNASGIPFCACASFDARSLCSQNRPSSTGPDSPLRCILFMANASDTARPNTFRITPSDSEDPAFSRSSRLREHRRTIGEAFSPLMYNFPEATACRIAPPGQGKSHKQFQLHQSRQNTFHS